MGKHLSLEQAIKNAEKKTRNRAYKLWFISRLFIPKAKRGFVYLLHSYLRWLDDFVDNPANDCDTKKSLINRQKEIIQTGIASSSFNSINTQEYYLFYFIRYLVESNQNYFLAHINNLIKSFEMDIERLRRDGVFSESELNEYLKLSNEATFQLSLAFIKSAKKPEELKGHIGNFFWYILTVRDFKEDIESGFVNLSKEEIQKYNINLTTILNDPNRFLWLKEKYPQIMELMREESKTLKRMPLVVKIVWLPSYFNLLWELNRHKYYNFQFAVEFKKNYLKEFVSFIEAIIICTKFSIDVLLGFE